MKKVLFICIHNSARSQMAEAYLRLLAPDEFQVESAGFEPTVINPLVVEAMAEEGVDLAGKPTQSVFELFKSGKTFDYVITVCEEGAEGHCPIFPGMTMRLHLPFPDPATLEGSHDERLAQVREIRDAIKARVQEFIAWDASNHEKRLGDTWQELSVKPVGDTA